MLAQYGLGQMQIHKGKNDKAIGCFERVLEAEPDNYGAMKILASLYSRTDSQTQQEKALKLFRKVRDGVCRSGAASLALVRFGALIQVVCDPSQFAPSGDGDPPRRY